MLFIDFLAFLCWFGTVYTFTVPIYYFITSRTWEERKRHLRVLGLLIGVWWGIKFFEKGILDNIMQYNTVPATGRWSSIHSTNILTNIEFHNPYPSFPSGHMLLSLGTGLTILRYYNSLNNKILVTICISVCAIIKVFMNMHSILDIVLSILLVISIYIIIIKLISYFKAENNINFKNEKNKESNLKKLKNIVLFVVLSIIFLYCFFNVTGILLHLIL